MLINRNGVSGFCHTFRQRSFLCPYSAPVTMSLTAYMITGSLTGNEVYSYVEVTAKITNVFSCFLAPLSACFVCNLEVSSLVSCCNFPSAISYNQISAKHSSHVTRPPKEKQPIKAFLPTQTGHVITHK